MVGELLADVAIVGGGPAGATAGCYLKKFNPSLDVLILEREKFPRDHVGESQLPPCCEVLNEIGCWDKVEAAGFPIKLGATYRWGRSPELWHFEFIASEMFRDEPRPSKYEGQRTSTAFQVDRAKFDKILLDHAKELGCRVREETQVHRVRAAGGSVEWLETAQGEKIQARHYLDASGNSGTLRRALGIECSSPTSLRNVAIWDYWNNADWAVEIGVGGTRVQILSLPYGWIWFIPLGPTRTSIGLIVPAAYLKESSEKPEQLYLRALSEESIVAGLLKNAEREGPVQTTRDWSFIADRICGSNWFLVGESAGFADPILSAGMTLAHMGGRDAAYTILELDRGAEDRDWLLEQYALRQTQRIGTHIRFADYWYTANAQFEDLKEFSRELALNAGLELTPDKAWAWLAQGGFISEDATSGKGGYPLFFIKGSGEFLTEIAIDSPLEKYNVFQLDLSDASWKDRADFRNGGVHRDQSYIRGGKILPISGAFGFLVHHLQLEKTSAGLMRRIRAELERNHSNPQFVSIVNRVPQALEAMILDGWIKASHDPNLPLPKFPTPRDMSRWARNVSK